MTRWVTDVSGRPAGDKSAELRSACGDYDVFAQVDYNPAYTCLFPQVFFLQTLLRYLPGACFVLNTRPTDHWLSSMRRWSDMMGRMIDGCPIHPRNKTGLGEWYDRHKMRARLAMRSAKCALEFKTSKTISASRLSASQRRIHTAAEVRELLVERVLGVAVREDYERVRLHNRRADPTCSSCMCARESCECKLYGIL